MTLKPCAREVTGTDSASVRHRSPRRPLCQCECDSPHLHATSGAETKAAKSRRSRLDWASLHQHTFGKTCFAALAEADGPSGPSSQPTRRPKQGSPLGVFTCLPGCALDALEQALHVRGGAEVVVHHSDRGTQYTSIRYTERLAAAGVGRSVGSVGDSYDIALAETINGLDQTEVIRHRRPWRNIDAVEFATLEWVDWFNNRRLLEPIGYVPPAEYEEAWYRSQQGPAKVA